jgi:hypothetical protein
MCSRHWWAKGLTGNVVDLPRDIFIRVIEDGDWRSWIDSRRRWLVESLGSAWSAGSIAARWDRNASVRATTGSDNGEAGGVGSISGSGSGSLAAT